jgi:hypothetical protein
MNILIILVVSIICVLPIAQCNRITCYTCSGAGKCTSNDKSLLLTCSCGKIEYACLVSTVFFFFYL